jgi:hypothetical protein
MEYHEFSRIYTKPLINAKPMPYLSGSLPIVFILVNMLKTL